MRRSAPPYGVYPVAPKGVFECPPCGQIGYPSDTAESDEPVLIG